MKKIIFFFLSTLVSAAALSQVLAIRPNTLYCDKFSIAHPVDYCVDSTPCRTFGDGTLCLTGTANPPANASITPLTCWSTATDYTCMEYIDSCATYSSDSNCKQVGDATCSKGPDGNLMTAVNPKTGSCASYTKEYSCTDPTKPSSSSYLSTTQCDTSGLQNGLVWTSSSKSSADDFVIAATGQEFARQLTVYGSKSGGGIDHLFPGQAGTCHTGYLGLKNCCKSGGVAITNNSLASKIGVNVVLGGLQQGAGYAAAAGSMYLYDTVLNSAPQFIQPGLESMLMAGVNNSSQLAGFGAFGVGTTAEAAGGLLLGPGGSAAIGNTGLYFNPYALAAAIAIDFIMQALSCTQEEKDLATAKQQNLCHYVGSYCSKKFLGYCYEHAQSYCCYNGLLGLAINEGAHNQLGISWGDARSPACDGLSPAQISGLDFEAPSMQSAMAPFKQQIMTSFENNIGAAISSGAVQTSISSTASSKSKLLCLQRQKLDARTVCN